MIVFSAHCRGEMPNGHARISHLKRASWHKTANTCACTHAAQSHCRRTQGVKTYLGNASCTSSDPPSTSGARNSALVMCAMRLSQNILVRWARSKHAPAWAQKKGAVCNEMTVQCTSALDERRWSEGRWRILAHLSIASCEGVDAPPGRARGTFEQMPARKEDGKMAR